METTHEHTPGPWKYGTSEDNDEDAVYIDNSGRLVYDTNDQIRRTYLDRPPGRYYVSEGITFVITGEPYEPPYFEVKVAKRVKKERVNLGFNFQVRRPSDYEVMEALAYKKRAEYREMLDNAERTDLLTVEMEAAQRRKEAQQEKRRNRNIAAVEAAKRDVAFVWSVYGPSLRMNEPYFTNQWI